MPWSLDPNQYAHLSRIIATGTVGLVLLSGIIARAGAKVAARWLKGRCPVCAPAEVDRGPEA